MSVMCVALFSSPGSVGMLLLRVRRLYSVLDRSLKGYIQWCQARGVLVGKEYVNFFVLLLFSCPFIFCIRLHCY